MFRDHPLADDGSIGAGSLILNILWLALGGAVAALGWFFAGMIMILTIIGIPFAAAAFKNGFYTLWPFGAVAVDRERLYGHDVGTGPLGFLGNLIWLVLAGWWLAFGHLACALLLAVTVIGIPFAWAHVKLAGFALWPIGRTIVRHDWRYR
jgi:uncharacterized membrane protein YccF (DUF307 family)